MNVIVSQDGSIALPGRLCRAALGRSGTIPQFDKREGDGATPLGRYRFRHVLYRDDRVEAPASRLPVRAIRRDDGWCDAPEDPAYNRLVRLPFTASYETLNREDGLYDIVVVLGHNDDPPEPGLGSAIFLHCKRGDYEPTEGCVALAVEDVRHLLAHIAPGDELEIR
jgi:L,D-peptidoglycan transpeptidase YkuD (ErfK/YbiS/YcfS/YnhG family)